MGPWAARANRCRRNEHEIGRGRPGESLRHCSTRRRQGSGVGAACKAVARRFDTSPCHLGNVVHSDRRDFPSGIGRGEGRTAWTSTTGSTLSSSPPLYPAARPPSILWSWRRWSAALNGTLATALFQLACSTGLALLQSRLVDDRIGNEWLQFDQVTAAELAGRIPEEANGPAKRGCHLFADFVNVQ